MNEIKKLFRRIWNKFMGVKVSHKRKHHKAAHHAY